MSEEEDADLDSEGESDSDSPHDNHNPPPSNEPATTESETKSPEVVVVPESDTKSSDMVEVKKEEENEFPTSEPNSAQLDPVAISDESTATQASPPPFSIKEVKENGLTPYDGL